MNIQFYKRLNGNWGFTDKDGNFQGFPPAVCKWGYSGTKVSVRPIGEPFFINGVEVTEIQKSATQGDNYTSLADFEGATANFFVKASSDGGLIDGTALDYASLPDPTLNRTRVYYVTTPSGGFLTWLNVYKYPKGIYTPNSSDVWELVPLKARFTEDSFTLLNITNWAEFFNFAFDVNIGDQLIYDGIPYTNKTGEQTVVAPLIDIINWEMTTPNNILTPFIIGNKITGNYVSIDPSGEIRLFGTATQFNDLRFPAERTKSITGKKPKETPYLNGQVLEFQGSRSQGVSFNAQMDHSYKVGSDLEAHIHLILPVGGAGAGPEIIKLDFTYSWAEIGAHMPTVKTLSREVDIQNVSAGVHSLFELGNIPVADLSTNTGGGVSSMLICSLSRDITVTNNTSKSFYFLEADFHYQMDSFGSVTEYIKYNN